ncbi:MAG: hypothetical protein KDE00_03965 [Rhodobacteraceae bacterium]|nr:hypothetical protein [Paracoccaceae bacterium]
MFTPSLRALAVAAALTTAGTAQAATVNLVADAGWERFAFGDVGTPVTSRSFSFSLIGSAIFSVVDAFVGGDSFAVFSNGSFLGNTSTPAAPGASTGMNFDAAFADTTGHSSGSWLLGPGNYLITLSVLTRSPGTGDHIGAVRLDTAPVPVPAGGALLLSGLGLAALMRKRRKDA